MTMNCKHSPRCLAVAGISLAATLACGPKPNTGPETTPPDDDGSEGSILRQEREAREALPKGPTPNELALDWLARESVNYVRSPDVLGLAVKRRGKVRFTFEGPDIGPGGLGELNDSLRFAVVDDGERPRIISDDTKFRLLVHIDSADTMKQIMMRTELRPTPALMADPPARGYTVLHPGARVTEKEQQGDESLVEYRRGKERYQGWLTYHSLSITAVGRADPPPPPPQHIVNRPTNLLLSPKNKKKKMGRLQKNSFVRVLHADTGSGYALVETRQQCDEDVSHVGFVPSSVVVEADFGQGFSCGSGGTRTVFTWGDKKKAPRKKVPAGQFLFDDTGEFIVGCALVDAEVAELGDDLYAVPSTWGPLPVRLAPEDFEGQCGGGGAS